MLVVRQALSQVSRWSGVSIGAVLAAAPDRDVGVGPDS